MQDRSQKISHDQDNRGMTLVEVMVALGISSVLMMGIIDLVQLSQRSVQNVTTLTDWNLMVNSVQQLINNPATCTASLKGLTFTAAANNPIGQIQYSPPGGPIVAQAGATYLPGYKVNTNAGAPYGINIVCDAACVSSQGSVGLTIPGPGVTNYKTFNAYIQIKGVKITKLANLQLGSQTLSTPDPGLGVALVVDSTNHILQCNGTAASQTAICYGLGGTWTSDNTCQIGAIQFFSDPFNTGNPAPQNPSPPNPAAGPYGGDKFQAGYPGASATLSGERIQLWGVPGSMSLSDYAVGISSSSSDPISAWWGGWASDPSMWFNTGGTYGGSFVFHTHTTGGLDMNVAKVWGTTNGYSLMVDPLGESNANIFLGGYKAGAGKYGYASQGPQFRYSGLASDPNSNAFVIYTTDLVGHWGPSLGIDNFGQTVIFPSNFYGNNSVVSFSDTGNLDAWGSPRSGEYILSSRNSGTWNLAFYQGYLKELELNSGHDVVVTPGRDFDVTTSGGNMNFSAPGRSVNFSAGSFNSDSTSFRFRRSGSSQIWTSGSDLNIYPDAYLYLTSIYDMRLNAGWDLNLNANYDINLTAGGSSYVNVNSRLWATTGGGNVPFSCYWATQIDPPAAQIGQYGNVGCAGGYSAITGGGLCWIGSGTGCPYPQDVPQLIGSYPNGSGWTIICLRSGHNMNDPAPWNGCAPGYTQNENVVTKAYCCRQ